MTRSMNRDVIISCAVTGAGDTSGRSEHVPVTPEQIASSALDAASAGAAIVHCHVRDLDTGKGTRTVDLYREVVDRIREKNNEVVVNLTAGMGGDLNVGPDDAPMDWQPGTDLVGGLYRLAHVEAIRPDICSMDCGSLNFGDHNEVYVSTPAMLRIMAERVRELGVRPELEVFDTGNLWFAETMIAEGLIDAPYWIQLCLSIPYGTPLDGEPTPRRGRVHLVRVGGHADAHGGPVGDVGRTCAGRARGQPLPGAGSASHQRPIG